MSNHIDKCKHMLVEPLLNEMKISNPTHRTMFKKFLQSVVDNYLENYTGCVKISNSLDVERSKKQRVVTDVDLSLQRENDQKVQELFERTRNNEMKRNMMQQTMKTALDGKVQRLIERACSDELSVKVPAHPQLMNRSKMYEIEDFCAHEIKRYMSDSEFIANRLLILQTSFDKLKGECIKQQKIVAARLSDMEKIKLLKFDELDEYESVLLE